MRLVISIATVNALQTIAMPPPIRARLSRRSPKRQWGKQRLIFLRIKGISLFLSVSAKHNRPADSRRGHEALEPEGQAVGPMALDDRVGAHRVAAALRHHQEPWD